MASPTCNRKGRVALMFSGGVDTTLAAYNLAKDFEQVHLLTFCNGICIRMSASEVHVRDLRKKLGEEKFVHAKIDTSGIFSELRKGFGSIIARYRSPLVFDLICRLSMEVATIVYCLKKDIRLAGDGNNSAQAVMFIQDREYLKEVELFFSSFGIEYIHPVFYQESRLERRKRLEDLGFKKGSGVLERMGITSQLANQPFCLWAFVAFFFTSRLRNLPLIRPFSMSLEKAAELRKDREKIARAIIADMLETGALLPGGCC